MLSIHVHRFTLAEEVEDDWVVGRGREEVARGGGQAW